MKLPLIWRDHIPVLASLYLMNGHEGSREQGGRDIVHRVLARGVNGETGSVSQRILEELWILSMQGTY